jgi:hypothetical protein
MCCNLLDQRRILPGEPGCFLFIENHAHLVQVVQQHRLVLRGHGDDVVHAQIAQYPGFYLNLFSIRFPLHLVSGVKFAFVQHADALVHFYAPFGKVRIKNQRHARFAIESALPGFLFPLVTVSVPVESDWLACFDVKAYGIKDGLLFLHAFFHLFINLLFEVYQLAGHNSIERAHG